MKRIIRLKESDIYRIVNNAVKLILSEQTSRRDKMIDDIKRNHFVRNDYERFIDSMNANKRSSFLSHYTPDYFMKNNVQTFQLDGANAGFALRRDDDGETDIISLHNNDNKDLKGLGDMMIDAAFRNGGTKCDHFDGYLSPKYENHGLKEYDRYKWDDQYAPKDWNYDTYGRPDVVFRKHRYTNLEKDFGMDNIDPSMRYDPTHEDVGIEESYRRKRMSTRRR